MLLRKISIYETPTHFYIVGGNISETRFHLLKIDRTEPADLKLGEPEHLYSKAEIKELLATVSGSSILQKADRRRGNGAETPKIVEAVTDAFGIVGAVRFLHGFYLVVITEARAVLKIGYHQIFKIENVEMIYVPAGNPPTDHLEEMKYKKAFESVDLKTDFYFSYTYDLSRTFQENALAREEGPRVASDSKFIWNRYLLEPLRRNMVSEKWMQQIIYGHIGHFYVCLNCAKISLTLIGRRSAEYAGTRFLKRGANYKGDVANEVETEQIVWEVSSSPNLRYGKFSSFVQRRGSVPLIWSQDPATRGVVGKPLIRIEIHEPHASTAAAHFRGLRKKYGSPIIVMNLVKRREKRQHEVILHERFQKAVNYLNLFVPVKEKIGYLAFDVARCNKKGMVLPKLEEIGFRAVLSHGWFQSFPLLHNRINQPHPLMEEFEAIKAENGRFLLQTGVSRTNCVDCLDRTNVAQFGIGKVALGCQLYSMGLVSEPIISPASEICRIFEEMFDEHGDTMAQQYAGSHLVHSVKTYKKTAAFQERSRDAIQTIQRYYSNTFSDYDKQHGINLFLGIYRPRINCAIPIWELPTDHYLHFPIGFKQKADYCAWTLEDQSENILEESSWNGRTASICSQEARKGVKEEMDLFDQNYRCFRLSEFDILCREFQITRTISIKSINQEMNSHSPFMKLFKSSDSMPHPKSKSKKQELEDDDDDEEDDGDLVNNDEEIEYAPDFLRITKPILGNMKPPLRGVMSKPLDSALSIGLKTTKEGYGVDISRPSDQDLLKYRSYAKLGDRNLRKSDPETQKSQTEPRPKFNDNLLTMSTTVELKPTSLFTLDSTFQCETPAVSKVAVKEYENMLCAYNTIPKPSARDLEIFSCYRPARIL
ncbi:hypothetical protein L596_010131 [Steinernema carpocapsae]|uniref:SAC domain-containing protein n=1 Tax=Steinernema carpocapsae TaxID=34508 RepID=A0A4U5PIQ8_STECR|nr:hypothetical protein L596_010131 [Steinernema carpocapsae]